MFGLEAPGNAWAADGRVAYATGSTVEREPMRMGRRLKPTVRKTVSDTDIRRYQLSAVC